MRSLVIGSLRWLATLTFVLLPALSFGQTPESAGDGPKKSTGEEKTKMTTGIQITRSAICLQVEEREPVDIDSLFPADVGTVFAYTKIDGVTTPTQVTHVWYHGEREMARVQLQVRNNGWRTWSSKKILPSWTGTWKVKILNAEGENVKTMEFQVEEPKTTEAGTAG